MKHNKFKRWVSVAAAAAMLVTGAGYLPQEMDANAADSALTGLNAQGITSQMTIGWNLGNSLDAHGNGTTNPAKSATQWGNPVPTQELFETVKAAGFNTVRIPTTWYPHIEYSEEKQMWIVNEEWMDYVKMTVDYAYELDMFVILNVHHEEWVNVAAFTDATYADASSKLTSIWAQVAEEFADYDQHLIFEGMNEPRQTGLGSSVEWGAGDANSRAYINNLNAEFVETVRGQGSSANAERLLMLPGYCASSDINAVRGIEVPANGGNIALSVHAYAPYFFTMDTSDNANHTFPGASGWGEDYEYALSNLFNSLKSVSAEKNAPIIIGEFSASDFNNTESRVNWAKSYLSKAKDAGIPCVLWDNNNDYDGTGEAHGYVYRLTNTWYTNSIPVIEAMMDVYGVESVLPEYQEYVKPAFDWSNVSIGEDWVEIYKPEGGKELAEWKNCTVNSMRQYLTEDYELVLVYASDTEPYLVMQGGWYPIYSSQTSDNPYTITFTYDDMQTSLTENEVSFDSMRNFYISASSSSMTIYGLYAVPVGGDEQPPTDGSQFPMGDANLDMEVTVLDIIKLQKYLLAQESLIPMQAYYADVIDDDVVDGFDLAALKRMVMSAK